MYATQGANTLVAQNGSHEDLVLSSFGLPVNPRLDIVTHNGAPILNKVDYVVCTYAITDPETNKTVFSDTGRIRGRGNSTWEMAKKPWKVKLDHKLPVLGMPASKDWALLANYIDPSRIRGSVVFWMFGLTGIGWAPRSRNMEVYLNGVYEGLYQFTESVEVASSRVNVDAIEADDVTGEAITGGYVWEVDVRIDENQEIGWWTRLGIPIIFDTPDGDVEAQYNYSKNYTQAAEDALFSEAFLNGGWKEYFDVDSWCDWYLVTELVSNNDSGFGASIKMTKRRGDTHIYCAPPWDYDASFGITFIYAHPVDHWWTRVGATWIARMLEDPSFVLRLKERWLLLRSNLLAANVNLYIETRQAEISEMRARDLEKWGTPSAPTLINYLDARMAWLHAELTTEAGKQDTTPPQIPTGFTVKSVTSQTITLQWDDLDANNGNGIVGYRVRRNGIIDGMTRFPYSITLDEVTIVGLTPSTQYSFTLECRDPAGNWSAPTASLVVSTT